MFEFSMHKWVDVSNREWGVTVANRSKYGLSADGAAIAVTLLRAPQMCNPAPNVWPDIDRRDPDRRKYADQREHWIEYALFPHAGNWKESHSWREGWDFNYPALMIPAISRDGSLESSTSFIRLDHPNLLIGAVKRQEDASDTGDSEIIVRIVEIEGKNTEARLQLHSAISIRQAKEVDILEWNGNPLRLPLFHLTGRVSLNPPSEALADFAALLFFSTSYGKL